MKIRKFENLEYIFVEKEYGFMTTRSLDYRLEIDKDGYVEESDFVSRDKVETTTMKANENDVHDLYNNLIKEIDNIIGYDITIDDTSSCIRLCYKNGYEEVVPLNAYNINNELVINDLIQTFLETKCIEYKDSDNY